MKHKKEVNVQAPQGLQDPPPRTNQKSENPRGHLRDGALFLFTRGPGQKKIRKQK